MLKHISHTQTHNKRRGRTRKSLRALTAALSAFAAAALLVASAALAAGIHSYTVYAEDKTQSGAKDDTQKTVTYRFPEIGVEVHIPDDLVCFTQNVTSNNPNLKLINADSADELRSLMQVNNIYLEAVPQEHVNYEIVISGKELSADQPQNLSDLSKEALEEEFQNYVNAVGKRENADSQENKVTETVTDSRIAQTNGVTYFVTHVTSVSENFVNVKVVKYYTIANGKYVTYTLQTSSSEVTQEMLAKLEAVVSTASYPNNLKKSFFDNYIVREIISSVLGFAGPIGLLALLLFLLTRMTSKKQKMQ